MSPVLLPGGTAQVSVRVRNNGKRAGTETVQLYVGSPAAAGEPPRILKAFKKITLAAGRSTVVHFDLKTADLAIWDTVTHQRSTVDGTYVVSVGSSSRDIRAQAPLRVPVTLGAQSIDLAAPALTSAGAKITVRGTLRNTGDQPIVNATATLAGWPSNGPQRVSFVAPHGTATVSWQVQVPANVPPGAAQLTATARWIGGSRQSATATATVKIAYPSLSAAFNGNGISDDANPAAGNFDGSGYSFSAQALASVGVAPGSSLTYNGLTYTWPSGPPNMVTASGQAITLNGTGHMLGFLGSANNGTASGPVTVTYTDGTSTTSTVTFADWYANAAVPGCALAVTAPYWNQPPNGIGEHAVSLYTSTLGLAAGKAVAAITLPDESRLHIFAATIG